MSGSEPSTWEEVLAAVEADAERSAALLVAAADHDAPFDPALEPVALELPPLSTMPALPPHLRERVAVLRDRIGELQAELAATLRAWDVPALPAPVVATAAPRLLDRRV